MNNDPEERHIKNLEDFMKEVPILHNKVKALKGNITKLSNRIQTLEMMAFQEQITSIGDELKQFKQTSGDTSSKQEEVLLELQQILVALNINSLVNNLGNIINNQLPNRSNLITQLIADATKAKQQTEQSEEPFEIMREFKDKWFKKVEDLGAKVINF